MKTTITLILTLTTAIILFTLPAYAQVDELLWAKKAGGTLDDNGNSVAIDGDGNILVTGFFKDTATFGEGGSQVTLTSDGEEDIFIAKYAPDGALIWAKRAGGSNRDSGWGIATDGSNNIVVTGRFKDTATFGKGDPNETSLTSSGGFDTFVAKYAPDGTLTWAIKSGGPDWDQGYGIDTDGSDNILMTGRFVQNLGGYCVVYVAKYDANGTLLWEKKSTGFAEQNARSITVDNDGYSIVTGSYYMNATFGQGEPNQTNLASAGEHDIFIAKYAPADGALQWAKRAGGAGSEMGEGISVDASGNSVLTGSFLSTAIFGPGEPNQTSLTSDGYYTDIFIAKYAPNGNLLWAKKAGGANHDSGYGITTDGSGYSLITGQFWGPATFGPGETNETILNGLGAWDIFIAMYDPDGSLLWTKQAGSSTNHDNGLGIASNVPGNGAITGFFGGTATYGEGGSQVSLTSDGEDEIFVARYFRLLITSHTPEQNEVDVAATSNIVVNFNENIDASTINENTFNVDGVYTGEITDSYTVNGNTVTFNSVNDFKPGEVITVTLTTGIQSSNGVNLPIPYTFQFTVKSAQSCGDFVVQSVISTKADYAYSVYVADIDGDGDMDVLSASENDDKIAWYENTDSNGSFGAQQVISTNANGAHCVYAADLDGDGDMDVLSASWYDDKIAWYENTDGNGSFGAQQVISSNNDLASSLFAADIDGDGDLDVLSASRDDNKIAWYENGNSWSETIISNSSKPLSVCAADIDKDGDMDVLSGSILDRIAWYENGNSWNETVISTNADNVKQIYTADMDGDGDMDVLSASYNDNKIAWFENGGAWNETIISDKASTGACCVHAADLDGDSDLDVISCSKTDDIIYWFENGNSWNETVVSTAANAPVSVFAADIDNDGDMDILSASFGDDKIAWYKNSCLDFGDAPDPLGATAGEYPTLLANDGARHAISSDLYLGSAVDADENGQPNANANGDDNDAGGDDEDGVAQSQLNDLAIGSSPAVEVEVINTTNNTATIKGWIDYNGNGVFEAGESATNTTAVSGKVTLNFPQLPIDAVESTFARFRISTEAADVENPTGSAENGEVEDYPATIDIDTDDDGIPDKTEGTGDRDGDGIPDNEDYDPNGWIYDESNGNIISGGIISVTPSAGVNIIQDGSNGYYQFTVSQNGDYTLSYTPPAGFNLSSSCAAQSGTLDISPSDPNPYVVGAGSKDGSTNKMTNWNCGDNPYYWDFHLETGDPVIINNNIPLKPQPTNIVLSAFTAEVNENGILLQWTTATEPDNAGFNVFRSQSEGGEYSKLNENLIPSQGNDTSGADYSYYDHPSLAGNYFYKLQSVSLTGDTSFYGPVSVILTEVASRKMTIPTEFSLSQNYPNPFNPETRIEYSLPEPARVTLEIYDVKGHLVRMLISRQQTAGTHQALWDGRDNNGAKVVSGVYFYHFQAAGQKQVFSETNKMILMK